MTSPRPHIAILGAGPTGLEAALAAIEHDFPFTLYEAAPAVSDYVRAWGHVRLFSPWSLDVSPRARMHLVDEHGLLVDVAPCAPLEPFLVAPLVFRGLGNDRSGLRAQLEALTEIGCTRGQGWYFAPAMAIDEFLTFAHANQLTR